MITMDFGRKRSMKREEWKRLWRHLRIMRRELRKATIDCMAFGTGFVEIGEHVPDGIRAVPPEQMIIHHDGSPEVRR